MRRPLTKNEYVLSALFAFIAAFPLATSANGQWFGVEPLASLTQRQRMEIIDNQRGRERAIMEVRIECEKRMRENPDTVCPDVNDYSLVRRFMRGQDISPVASTGSLKVSGTGSTRMPIIGMPDLGRYEKALLRRFERSGHCPANLDNVLPGFQRLCAKEVRPAPRMLRGILGENYVR